MCLTFQFHVLVCFKKKLKNFYCKINEINVEAKKVKELFSLVSIWKDKNEKSWFDSTLFVEMGLLQKRKESPWNWKKGPTSSPQTFFSSFNTSLLTMPSSPCANFTIILYNIQKLQCKVKRNKSCFVSQHFCWDYIHN